MAAITPVIDDTNSYSDTAVTYLWETLTESDTGTSQRVNPARSVLMSFSVVGGGGSNFGGATVVLQGSHDNTNFFTVKDSTGSDVSFTADGAAEVPSTFVYYRPSASGGTSQDVDFRLTVKV